MAQLVRYTFVRSVEQLSRTTFDGSGSPPHVRICRPMAAKAALPGEPRFTGRYGEWDKLIGFAVALVMHSFLFLGLWRYEKVHQPSRGVAVSIDYLGPSSQGKAAETSAPKVVSRAPLKHRPTRTDTRVSARPAVSTADVASLAVEATHPAEAAPAREVAGSTEVPGSANSPAASTTTRTNTHIKSTPCPPQSAPATGNGRR